MPDVIITLGDEVQFMPPQGFNITTPLIFPITAATGTAKVAGQPIVILTDIEGIPFLPASTHTQTSYLQAGSGQFVIPKLVKSTTAKTTNGQIMVLKGVIMDAEYRIVAPAIDPAKKVPEPIVAHKCTAEFKVKRSVLTKAT